MLSYFSEIRMDRIELTEDMTGSEKQIEWAKQIKLDTCKKVSKILRKMAEVSSKFELATDLENKMIVTANSMTSAKWWIDNRFMTDNELATTFCK